MADHANPDGLLRRSVTASGDGQAEGAPRGPPRRRALAGAEGVRVTRDGVRFVSTDLSVFSVFAATLFVLLYRISGEPRRSIGVPWQNRSRAVTDTVGLLMEQDPFTVTLHDDDSFESVIRKVHEEALAVMRRLPFAAGNPGGRQYDVALNVVKVSVGPFAGFPRDPGGTDRAGARGACWCTCTISRARAS